MCTNNDGSALRIGFWKDSGNLNLGRRGSLLNSAFLRYASPMDLEICKEEAERRDKSIYFQSSHVNFYHNKKEEEIIEYNLYQALYSPNFVFHHNNLWIMGMQ